MPRARNIKPSLFKNEVLGEADPLLTILFAGLWCLADREGRLEDRPKRIKAEIFPYRELPDFNRYLTELAQLGFIERFSVENTAIIEVLNFTRHQSPHKTEKPSELPGKPLNTGVTVNAPLNNGSVTEVAALIPDSGFLIPDTPVGEAEPPNVWDLWTNIVGNDRKNRSFLGQQIKHYGEECVARAVATLATRKPRPVEPLEFLVGMLRDNTESGEALF